MISANVKAVLALDGTHFVIKVETFYHIWQQLQTPHSEHDSHRGVVKGSRGLQTKSEGRKAVTMTS
ncbi:MAG: hypothetical protein JO327_08200 [Nitrososphaeraceae archaeon]|nr:hypothetical protein [Nitrososphaeraceae archaeon]MBV9668096.1 hypothetical protein [Nitrososphaeraceae archaeon]